MEWMVCRFKVFLIFICGGKIIKISWIVVNGMKKKNN